jgi:hypothetical protein
VPFVRIDDVRYRNIFDLPRGNNRIAFRHFATQLR